MQTSYLVCAQKVTCNQISDMLSVTCYHTRWKTPEL